MKTPHIVVGGIFDRCDGEDKNQRHDGGEPREGGDLRDQLEGRERGRCLRGRALSLLLPTPFPPPCVWLAELHRVYRRPLYLQNEKEQEVGIGDFLELLEEVDRQEGENVVLGGLDAVTLGQWERR